MSAARRHHWPALDGLRAVGIVLVVAYHLGHLGGGWIGVDVFFVLSGYLITNLLLDERRGRGRINLPAFWARRARRLLPAVLLLLCTVGIYAWAGGPGVVPAQLRAPALATLFYAANWQQIVAAHSYFAAFSAPNPLVHTWSLAIEEQYYVAWPLLVTGVGTVALRRRGRKVTDRSMAPLIAVTAVLLVASVIWMGVCSHLLSVNRAYLGTDTRAWELLLGGLCAMVTSTRPAAHERRWSIAAFAGAAGLASVVVLAGSSAGELSPPAWMWDGGLFAAAVGTIVLLVSVVKAPGILLARLLSLPAMRWLGRISYSLYLWHYPVIVVLTTADTGLSGAELLLARLGVMTACTCFSYYLVEQPLRRADWHRWWRRGLVPLGVGATAALLVAGTVTPAAAGVGKVTALSSPSASRALIARPGFKLTAAARPSASHPLRVWIMGDSVMNDSSPGITAALEATGDATIVENSSFGGWGLTTDSEWRQGFEQIIQQYRPQLVLGTWSWDNQVAEEHPATYEALLHQALATILTPGDGVEAVVLLQFPQVGPPTTSTTATTPAQVHADWVQLTELQDAWDRIARLVSGQFGNRAAYLTTAQLFAPHGRFLVWMRNRQGHWVRARKLDDAHMCPYGAALFGELVTAALRAPLGLGTLRPGWEDGAWTRDPRYNDPPGACPADQPPPHYDGLLVPKLPRTSKARATSRK